MSALPLRTTVSQLVLVKSWVRDKSWLQIPQLSTCPSGGDRFLYLTCPTALAHLASSLCPNTGCKVPTEIQLWEILWLCPHEPCGWPSVLRKWKTLWSSLMEFPGSKHQWSGFPKSPSILGLPFPGGVVIKNPPANAGDTSSIPGLGRSHMPQSN